MIGTAVAVATQRVSTAFAEATLCVPARTALPLAPGAPLVLADNAFLHFPRCACSMLPMALALQFAWRIDRFPLAG